jgi:hypothetical protein
MGLYPFPRGERHVMRLPFQKLLIARPTREVLNHTDVTPRDATLMADKEWLCQLIGEVVHQSQCMIRILVRQRTW